MIIYLFGQSAVCLRKAGAVWVVDDAVAARARPVHAELDIVVAVVDKMAD